jgi:ubiquinone/menaquinone biosynthesis C-methylase UbiE
LLPGAVSRIAIKGILTGMSENKATEFPYLHGFSPIEQERLRRQARFAEYTIFHDVNFSDCKNVLEVGCGVGAQSEILLRRFPDMHLTGIDLADAQLKECKRYLGELPYAKNRFDIKKMDATQLEFAPKSFDGAFLCWVLEHMTDPLRVLSEVRRMLAPGGKIVVNEVMNSSFFLDPYSPNVWQYWMAFNDYQNSIGGDPFVGMKLGNLLLSLGFKDIETSMKTWHFDNRWPEKRKESIDFWQELMLSAADQLVKAGQVTQEVVDGAREEMKRVANDPNAVFHFSFMQARARVY